MKKQYIEAPAIKQVLMDDELLASASAFTPDGGSNQTITPTDENYDGEFGAKGTNVWED